MSLISKDIAETLAGQLDTLKSQFSENQPFPHIILDDFFPKGVIDSVRDDFPSEDDESLWEVNRMEGIEVKMRSNWQSEYDMPEKIREMVHFLNSGLFLRHLAEMTGIPKLISDPYYTGGGLNCSLPGGHLDVHVDGNYHDAMGVHRRLNLLVYLNKEWDESWGGDLSFYDETGDVEVARIAPKYNRVVIFETHDKTFHGHPEPLKCPEGESRKSLILYYYTSEKRPSDQITVERPHSALWRSKNWKDKRGNVERS